MTQPMDNLTLPEPWADTIHGWAYTARQMREEIRKHVEAEREACAKVCEDMNGPIEIYNPQYVHYIDCASAIRARGQA